LGKELVKDKNPALVIMNTVESSRESRSSEFGDEDETSDEITWQVHFLLRLP
jgi:hypothetical protein